MDRRIGSLAVLLLLSATVPLSQSWLVRCPAIFSNPVVSVIQATMRGDKKKADTTQMADGTLKITVFSSTKGTDVKFELTSNDLYFPLFKSLNYGPAGATGDAILTIPGTPTIALRADGITYKSVGWIKQADSAKASNGQTVTNVLKQLDLNPANYYVQVSAFKFLGSIRGQLQRGMFWSSDLCGSGNGRVGFLYQPSCGPVGKLVSFVSAFGDPRFLLLGGVWSPAHLSPLAFHQSTAPSATPNRIVHRPTDRSIAWLGDSSPTAYLTESAQRKQETGCLQVLPASELSARYELIDMLGEGQYGTVWRCEERDTGRLFACKHISLAGLGEKGIKAAVREIEVMATLSGNRNVVSLQGIYEDAEGVYVIMEYCDGGDLLNLIQKKGLLPEMEAQRLFLEVTRGVKQCHDNGVIHRDIKPENILLVPGTTAASAADTRAASPTPAPKNPFTSLQLNPLRARSRSLADFGLSLTLRPGQRVVGYAGSFPYEAPEVLANKAYDQSADIFSLGVTLYAMLSGTWPAFHRSRCLDDAVDWELPCWRKVSDVAKDLIRWMVSPLPHMRPSADEVLAHPWFAPLLGFPAQPASPRSVVRTFRTWRRERSLRQEEERQAVQKEASQKVRPVEEVARGAHDAGACRGDHRGNASKAGRVDIIAYQRPVLSVR
ncbi:unnamed protein product [Closterium sp. Yama58-4]|nr:unnamed protein product [Closterium sp. Yama58-4]